MPRPDPQTTPDPAHHPTPTGAHRPHAGGFGVGDLAVLAALILSTVLIGLVAWIALTISTPGR